MYKRSSASDGKFLRKSLFFEDTLPFEHCFEEDEKELNRRFTILLNKMQKFETVVIEKLIPECSEELIRKRFIDSAVKEIRYDPKRYSVFARETVGIHRRLMKLTGNNIIRLQDSDFIERCLDLMLGMEEEERRGRERQRITDAAYCEYIANRTTKKEKEKLDRKADVVKIRLTAPDSSSVEVEGTKLKVESPVTESIWNDEDMEESVKLHSIERMFGHARSIINDASIFESALRMKRSGCALDLAKGSSETEDKNEDGMDAYGPLAVLEEEKDIHQPTL